MINMNDDEKIERIKLFLKENTYTYILDIYKYNFNGFIKKFDNNTIIFLDDEIGEIPIMIKEIKFIGYSKKAKRGGNGNK